MKVCTQCGKEIKKVVIVNKEIVCRECAEELNAEIDNEFEAMGRGCNYDLRRRNF